MVDIYGRSARGKARHSDVIAGDLSKYATLDQVRNEIDDFLNITNVDQNEVVVFQDKQGRLMTSNIKKSEILTQIPNAVDDNIVTFTDQGKIKDSGKSVNDYVRKVGGEFSGAVIMNKNKITDLGNPTTDSDAINKKYIDDKLSDQVTVNKTINDFFWVSANH